MPVPRLRDGDALLEQDQSALLIEATTLALQRAVDILKMDLDPEDKNFPRLVAAQGATIRTVISTAVRINEHGFRRRTHDKMGEILDMLKRNGTAAKVIDG